MRKFKLELDDLHVDSFITLPGPLDLNGTVDAFDSEGETRFGPSCRRACPSDGATCTEPTCVTCAATCPATCANTCDDATCPNTCPYTCDDNTCVNCTANCPISANDTQCGSCWETCGGTCPV
ncbi:MAG TPA: hypothetical protein VF746_32145 [Longimicrobium sp.]|jgi:hypothetical protein